MECLMARLTWPELQERLKTHDVALLPTGYTERHGHHLPMGTDFLTSSEVARRVGERTGAVVLPTLPYGVPETADFPSIHLSAQTYLLVLKELARSVLELGFGKLLVINAHGSNNRIIYEALHEVHREFRGRKVLGFVHCLSLLSKVMPEVNQWALGHSDARETAIMLAIDPERVNMSAARLTRVIEGPLFNGLERRGVHTVGIGRAEITLFHQAEDLAHGGGYGQLENATPELGERMLAALTDGLVEIVEALKGVRLAG